MKILVTGSNGLLGSYFKRYLNHYSFELYFYDRQTVDITSISILKNILNDIRPEIVINCAAYTNVDQAEIDTILCLETNYNGVVNLVDLSNKFSFKLIQLSTDYVFDGYDYASYHEYSTRNPLNSYGNSKLMAEQYIQDNMTNFIIVRTSWLYGVGGSHFVLNIINQLLICEPFGVIVNQNGSPTYAKELSKAICELINKEFIGVIHLTNNGCVSRYELACYIAKILKINTTIHRLNHIETLALRPNNPCLDNTLSKQIGIFMPNWKESLEDFILNELDY
jgi:dTDP-4-dehydrorhamnose reductase